MQTILKQHAACSMLSNLGLKAAMSKFPSETKAEFCHGKWPFTCPMDESKKNVTRFW